MRDTENAIMRFEPPPDLQSFGSFPASILTIYLLFMNYSLWYFVLVLNGLALSVLLPWQSTIDGVNCSGSLFLSQVPSPLRVRQKYFKACVEK